MHNYIAPGFSQFCDAVELDDGHVLRVAFKTDYKSLSASMSSLDLNNLFGNNNGRFAWGSGGFKDSTVFDGSYQSSVSFRCEGLKNSPEGDQKSYALLRANLMLPDGSSLEDTVNLDRYIGVSFEGETTECCGLVPCNIPAAPAAPSVNEAGFSQKCQEISLVDGRILRVVFKSQYEVVDVEGLSTPPSVRTLDLDAVLGNHLGRFVWGRKAFSGSAVRGRTALKFRFDHTAATLDADTEHRDKEIECHTILHARLRLPDQSWLDASVDLDKHIGTRLTGDNNEEMGLGVFKLPRSRTVVLCFDGTQNQFDDTNTNVVHLVRALKKNDPKAQEVYYQEGIGTYGPPGLLTSIGLKVASIADKAFAWYLDEHVMAGYRYLVQTYQTGDKICIFGFSRGAHTARAVAGMIHSVGLIPANNIEHVPFAYQLYKKGDMDECERFKSTFSWGTAIDFLGVWDTVNSTGMLYPRSLPLTDKNPGVLHFRQALSLDECRVKFLPSVLNEEDSHAVKQVWFAGDHCDVGGGNELDKDHWALANFPLRWMVKEAIECDTGLLFRADAFAHPETPRIYMRVDEEEGLVKAGVSYQPQADQGGYDHEHTAYLEQVAHDLRAKRWSAFSQQDLVMWWIMEYTPLLVLRREGDGGESKKAWEFRLNRGRGREIDLVKGKKIKLHVTVKKLLTAPDAKADAEHPDLRPFEEYKCQARFRHAGKVYTLNEVLQHEELKECIEWEDEKVQLH